MLVSGMVGLAEANQHHDGLRPPLVLFGSKDRGLGVKKKLKVKVPGWMKVFDQFSRQNPISVTALTVPFAFILKSCYDFN